jgi:hypothetical protein
VGTNRFLYDSFSHDSGGKIQQTITPSPTQKKHPSSTRQVFFLLGYQPRFYAKAEGNNFCYKYILSLMPLYLNYILLKKHKNFMQTLASVLSPVTFTLFYFFEVTARIKNNGKTAWRLIRQGSFIKR